MYINMRKKEGTHVNHNFVVKQKCEQTCLSLDFNHEASLLCMFTVWDIQIEREGKGSC